MDAAEDAEDREAKGAEDPLPPEETVLEDREAATERPPA